MPQPQRGETPDYLYIDHAKDLRAAVHKLRQQPLWQPRTIDTETTGCVPFVHRLKVVQIGVKGLLVYVLQIERIPTDAWGPLREYLAETRPNILQNAKFDLKMLAAENLPLSGPVRDTMIRSKLYHLGDRKIKHDLKTLAFKWCKIELDKTEQTSFVADESREPLSLKQTQYAVTDITVTTAVEAGLAITLQDRRTKRPGILPHVEREERFLPLLAKLENQGVLVDPVAVEALAAEIKIEMEALETQLAPVLQPNFKQLKLNLGRKPAFTPTKFLEEQIKVAFQLEDAETKTLLRAAQKQLLVKIVQHAALWRQLDCCNELLQKHNSKTGKWHPDHSQVENLQGSLGPSKLKIELLERLTESWRKKPLRLLQPDNGCEFLEVSFPDLELILLAHYSQDTALQHELTNGESPVESLADAIAATGVSTHYDNYHLAQALWRGVGILNQKGIYLQSWLLSEFALVLDPQQCKALQTLIPERYPQLAAFQAKVGDLNYELRKTILGALRLWSQSSPKDVRNFLVWSSISELLKECAVWLQPFCATNNSRIAFIGEQSLLLEVPATQTEALTEAVLETLVDQFRQHCPQIAIAIEVARLTKYVQ